LRIPLSGKLGILAVFALLLSSCVLVSNISDESEAASVVDSGSCGAHLTWALYDDGLLGIKGSGEMDSWSSGNSPWYSHINDIKRVNIGAGVTSVGSHAFYHCSSLKSVDFGNNSSLVYIGENAFSDCDSLQSVVIPSTVTYIGSCAFYLCHSLQSVTIPDSVTAIGWGAFSACDQLSGFSGTYQGIVDGVMIVSGSTVVSCAAGHDVTSAEIPSGVTSIGDFAFFMCSSLLSVTIPDSVASVGHFAFHGCDSLLSVTIPASVESIESLAFSDCSSLALLIFRGPVESIGNGAFSLGSWNDEVTCTVKSSMESGFLDPFSNEYTEFIYEPLHDVVDTGVCGDDLTWTFYDDGLLEIGGTGAMDAWAKDGCPWHPYLDDIVYLSIGASVTTVGENAFYNCIHLLSVDFGEDSGLEFIGNYAFYYCSSLQSVLIPSGVVSIGSNAFENCFSLQTLDFGEDGSLMAIGDYGFSDCGSLRSVEIPSGVTIVGMCAFFMCTSLRSVAIPDSVLYIGDGAFSDCLSLNRFDGDYQGIVDGVMVVCDGTLVSCAAGSRVTSADIPAGVEAIGDFAFIWCTSLQSVAIPDSVMSVGMFSFHGCTSLQSVGLGEDSGLLSIGDCAFMGCSSLQSVGIPSGTLFIGEEAFEQCSSLVSITFYGKVADIGDHAFALGMEQSQVSCTVTSSMDPGFLDPYLNEYTEFIYESFVVVVDSGVCGFDMTWALYDNGLLEIAGNGEMSNWASGLSPWFSHCGDIRTVSIGDGVASVGSSAFYNCTALESVTIPESVTSFGKHAFTNCASLLAFDLPESVTYLGSYAFLNCISLQSVTIHSDVSYIGSGVFSGCTSLNGFEGSYEGILDGVMIVWDGMLVSCAAGDEVIAVTIPDSVGSIGDYAFYNCISLQSVSIPDSAASIGDYAFNGCCSLSLIAFKGAVPTIGDSAFCLGNPLQKVECAVYASASDFLEPYSDVYTIFEYYLPPVFEITFDSAGGVPAITKMMTGTDGRLKSFPEDPVTEGYAFVGWFTDTILGDEVSEYTVFTEDTTVYAHWELIVHVTGVKLDRSSATMDLEETITLTASVIPVFATDQNVVWSTSNAFVATVDQYGVVKAVGAGEATITVTTEEGGFTATCQISVVPEPADVYSVTVHYMCDGVAIKEPDKYSLTEVWSVYNNPTEVDGYRQVGGVKIGGDLNGMTLTFNYERVAPAVSLTAYLTYKGSNVSVALIGDGTVPDGKVTLKMSYSEYDSELGLWVAEQSIATYDVVNADGSSFCIINEDISSQEHYKDMFSIVAQYVSDDGSIKESSAKIYFTPS